MKKRIGERSNLGGPTGENSTSATRQKNTCKEFERFDAQSGTVSRQAENQRKKRREITELLKDQAREPWEKRGSGTATVGL